MSAEPPLPQLLSSEKVYEGRLIDVSIVKLRLPDGTPAERVIVEHPGAVAIVALDEQDRWLLVSQYRHPAGQELLEIPAGTREPGEPPEVTAHRELREETGFAAGSLVRLGGAWMSPGFLTEYMDFYLATELRPDPLPQDEDEGLSPPQAVTLAELEAAVEASHIEDAKTILALALFARHRRARSI